jgi:hypothetical protein
MFIASSSTPTSTMSPRPEPRDRDRRIAACRQRELRTGREVQRELGDRVETLGVLQEVDVVEASVTGSPVEAMARAAGDRRRGDDVAGAVTAAPV